MAYLFSCVAGALLLRTLLKWLPAFLTAPPLPLLFLLLTALLPTLLLRTLPPLRPLYTRERACRPLMHTVAFLPPLIAASMLLSLLMTSLLAETVTPTPYTFFTAVLLPPLSEELFYRYGLLTLLRRHSEGGALWLTSLVFALAHSPLQWPSAFVAGLLLGYVTLMSKSILPAIIIHFANNLISFMLLLFPDATVYYGLLGGVLALSAVSLVYLYRQRILRHACRTLAKKGSGRMMLAALRSPLAPCLLLQILLAALTLF